MSWAPDYATTAQLKAFLRISDVTDDTELASAITAASRAIDRATGRQFGQVASTEARSYDAFWDRHRPTPAWVVTIDDLQDITGLAVSVAGTAVTGYTLESVNAVKIGKAFTRLVFTTGAEANPTCSKPQVDITAKWGWSATPVTVLQACKVQAGRLFKRRDALFGVAGSPQDGSELRLLAKIDPDVAVMLVDYTRVWGAA